MGAKLAVEHLGKGPVGSSKGLLGMCVAWSLQCTKLDRDYDVFGNICFLVTCKGMSLFSGHSDECACRTCRGEASTALKTNGSDERRIGRNARKAEVETSQID